MGTTERELIAGQVRDVEAVPVVGVPDGPTLRVRRGDDGWRTVDTHGETIHEWASPGYVGAAVRKPRLRLPGVSVADRSCSLFIDRAIADVVDALDGDREPELAAQRALRATEVLFTGWESARRRGRVDLLLDATGTRSPR